MGATLAGTALCDSCTLRLARPTFGHADVPLNIVMRIGRGRIGEGGTAFCRRGGGPGGSVSAASSASVRLARYPMGEPARS
jgi:hypothetical protein